MIKILHRLRIPSILLKPEIYQPLILSLITLAFIIDGTIGNEITLPNGRGSSNGTILSITTNPSIYYSLMALLSLIFIISLALLVKGIYKNITRRSNGTNNP